MFDSHCHLDFHEFDADRAELVLEARRQGVEGFLVPGVHAGLWQAQEALRAVSGVVLAVGLHPWWLEKGASIDASVAELDQRAQRLGAVAFGECGLDSGRGDLDVSEQLPWFEAQLACARQRELPVVVHQVGARDEFLRALERGGPLPRGGVVHGFSGDASWARALLARGFHLGFGGRALSTKRAKLREAFLATPIDRVLLETDAPAGAPPGQWSVPADLAWICRDLAALRALTATDLARASDQNLAHLLGPGSLESKPLL